jgi:hypothetical protein
MPGAEPKKYQQRRPEATVLYRVIQEHLESFLEHVQESSGQRLPTYVENEFRDYLECGLHAHGFARAVCETCGDELLMPFSYKLRGIVHAAAMHTRDSFPLEGMIRKGAAHRWCVRSRACGKSPTPAGAARAAGISATASFRAAPLATVPLRSVLGHVSRRALQRGARTRPCGIVGVYWAPPGLGAKHGRRSGHVARAGRCRFRRTAARAGSGRGSRSSRSRPLFEAYVTVLELGRHFERRRN